MRKVACLFLFVVLLFSDSLFARLVGSGTVADPYIIADRSGFDEFCQNNTAEVDYWAVGVVTSLNCDLNLSGSDYMTAIVNNEETAQLFEPGFQGEQYYGIFKGNDHSITGFYFYPVSDYWYFGLFGSLADSAEVTGVRISGVTCELSHSSGSNAGLIAAINRGTISDCQIDVSLSGDGELNYFGGIAGLNYGTITRCKTAGQMSFSSGQYIGGICGQNMAIVSNCISACTISAHSYVGGITGMNQPEEISPEITNSYCKNDILGQFYIGGIAGWHGSGKIQNCYFSAGINGYIAGEIVGLSYSAVIDSYYLEYPGQDTEYGTAISESQMRDKNTFANWDFTGSADIAPIWGIRPGEYPHLSFEYPLVTVPALDGLTLEQATTRLTDAGLAVGQVAWQTSFTVVDGILISQQPQQGSKTTPGNGVNLIISSGVPYSGGEGTVVSPYIINSLDDLLDMSQRCSDPANTGDLTGHFRLTADISLSGHSFGSAVIGGGISQITAFAGYFDGFNKTISGMKISGTDDGNEPLGLFGRLAPTGTIANLNLADGSITTNTENAPAGLLVGESAGQILNCHVQGQVSGKRLCGGLCGTVSGAVEGCSAAVMVSAGNMACEIGGLAGMLAPGGSLVRCQADSDLTLGQGSHLAGGLIGSNIGGPATDSYARSRITCGDNSYNIGGFCGATTHAISRCFADTALVTGPGSQLTGGFLGEGNIGTSCYYYALSGITDTSGAVNINFRELSQSGSFTGFDFVNIWQLAGRSGPTLRQYQAGDINQDGTVNMADLAILAAQWLR